MPRTRIPPRPLLRGALIAGLILLALALDALTGLNVTLAAACVAYGLVQLVAMTAGIVGVAAGLLVWAFTRFRNRTALYVALGALALVVAALVLKTVFMLIGIECIG